MPYSNKDEKNASSRRYHHRRKKDPVWLEKLRKKARDVKRRKRAADPNYNRKHHLIHCYGITFERWLALNVEQGGLCAICRRPETVKRKGKVMLMAVDHCHKTGKVRGLLCLSCNHGLGKFREDYRLLLRAALYLAGGKLEGQ